MEALKQTGPIETQADMHSGSEPNDALRNIRPQSMLLVAWGVGSVKWSSAIRWRRVRVGVRDECKYGTLGSTSIHTERLRQNPIDSDRDGSVVEKTWNPRYQSRIEPNRQLTFSWKPWTCPARLSEFNRGYQADPIRNVRWQLAIRLQCDVITQ